MRVEAVKDEMITGNNAGVELARQNARLPILETKKLAREWVLSIPLDLLRSEEDFLPATDDHMADNQRIISQGHAKAHGGHLNADAYLYREEGRYIDEDGIVHPPRYDTTDTFRCLYDVEPNIAEIISKSWWTSPPYLNCNFCIHRLSHVLTLTTLRLHSNYSSSGATRYYRSLRPPWSYWSIESTVWHVSTCLERSRLPRKLPQFDVSRVSSVQGTPISIQRILERDLVGVISVADGHYSEMRTLCWTLLLFARILLLIFHTNGFSSTCFSTAMLTTRTNPHLTHH